MGVEKNRSIQRDIPTICMLTVLCGQTAPQRLLPGPPQDRSSACSHKMTACEMTPLWMTVKVWCLDIFSDCFRDISGNRLLCCLKCCHTSHLRPRQSVLYMLPRSRTVWLMVYRYMTTKIKYKIKLPLPLWSLTGTVNICAAWYRGPRPALWSSMCG